MKREEIQEHIIQWITQSTGETCTLDMDIMEEVGLSSIELMELLARIEQFCGVRISARNLRMVVTVGDLAELVCKKKGL